MFSLWWFLAGIIVLVYIACIFQSATLMMFVFVLGALFLFGACNVIWRCRKVKAHLHVPIEISEKGRENLVKINISNAGGSITKGKALIVVKDVIRRRNRRYWLKLPAIQTGENEFVESIVFPEMGKYELFLKRIRVYDLSGLVHGDIWMKAVGRVQVMPQMIEVPAFRTEATRNFYGESDTFDEHLPGYDQSEIFQVREYQRGDRMQQVHWKLTAKHEKLVVKEHSLPKSCPVVLFLEYRPGLFGSRRNRLLTFMEAAAGLSFSIMDAGCPHYIAWYDKGQKEVLRLRVEDEESMFYFMGILMTLRFGRCKGALVQQYAEKYRYETYVRGFVLDEKLVLRNENEVLKKLSARNLEKTMSETELIL